jgi:hypothetical protein
LAKFLVDGCVSEDVKSYLIAWGHPTVNARDLGLAGLSDAHHLLFAAKNRRILVTHDGKDYRLLHIAWNLWSQDWGVSPRPEHSGVLIHPHRPALSVA